MYYVLKHLKRENNLYIEPEIESSYRKNNLGYTIYETILKLKPKVVIDFGILHGYSIVTIAQALRDLDNGGKVIGYDLFEGYKYKNSIKNVVNKNIIEYDVVNFVELRYGNFYKWVENPDEFDILHLDISNNGDIIELADKKLPNKTILFEGGSEERDKVEWMTEYNFKLIYPLKDKINYKILNKTWPSISGIRV